MDSTVKPIYLRPIVEANEIVEYAEAYFGLQLSSKAKELVSYDDQNFYARGKLKGAEQEEEYLLKIMNSTYSYNSGFIDAMDQAMIHFHEKKNGIRCSVPIRSLSGSFHHKIELPVNDPIKMFSSYSEQGNLDEDKIKLFIADDPLICATQTESGKVTYYMPHYVRLLTYVPGKVLGDLEFISDDTIIDVGVLVAEVQTSLKSFTHSSLVGRHHLWNLEDIGGILPLIDQIKELDKRDKNILYDIISTFVSEVIPALKSLPSQVIHADLNYDNILYQVQNNKIILTGIIDFGDIIHACYLLELGIALTYVAMLRPKDPIHGIKLALEGYCSKFQLQDKELILLPAIIMARLAQSATISLYSHRNLERTDNYVVKDAYSSLKVMHYLKSLPDYEVIDRLRRK